jgi:glycosyltransferase involved in cell wall biosynthesis
MTKTLSIITATYNAAEVLPGLIASLRAQTDRDFEWVVVDGGSWDDTVELLKNASDVIGKWISEPDFGIYDAMNKAVRAATGDYYLICGADDRLAPSAIADYRRVAMETQADMVSACIDTTSGLIYPGMGQSWRRGHAAFVSQHSVGLLIRRKLHDQFGYYSRRFPIAADQYFIKRVCMSPEVRFVCADFVAGSYSIEGVSGSDIPGTMTEFFRVQLETEPYPSFQILLFALRLTRHWIRIAVFGKSRRLGTR